MYAVLTDLYARFGEEEINQIADTDGTRTPDHALIDRAISDASAEINAALVARYRLPMAPVPVLLTRLCCDLSREALFSISPPDHVVERAKQARKTLMAIASGQLNLGMPSAPLDNASQGLVQIVSGRKTSPWGV